MKERKHKVQIQIDLDGVDTIALYGINQLLNRLHSEACKSGWGIPREAFNAYEVKESA